MSCAATVVSLSGSPELVVALKTPGMPMRDHCRPVIKEAREALHTGHAEYHEVKVLPERAKESNTGVLVVGWPLKPVSP